LALQEKPIPKFTLKKTLLLTSQFQGLALTKSLLKLETKQESTLSTEEQGVIVTLKSNAIVMLTSTRFNPGPGAYDSKNTIDSNGNYFIPTMKNPGTCTFKNPSNSKAGSMFGGNANPGPGAYNLKIGIADKSSSFISGFASPKTRTFNHSDRVTIDIPKSIRSKSHWLMIRSSRTREL
jgi:hypothetical protein